jgi:hypothetical protein
MFWSYPARMLSGEQLVACTTICEFGLIDRNNGVRSEYGADFEAKALVELRGHADVS